MTELNTSRLWEERRGSEPDGDVIIICNGQFIYAHWCVLKEVDFFRRLAPVNLRDGLSPSYLDIGGSMSVTILEKVLEFIYLEHCFVDKTEVLTDFVAFLQAYSLKTHSFDQVICSVSPENALTCYRLGHGYNIIPLRRRAWRIAVENGCHQEVFLMAQSGMNPNTIINRYCQSALHISIEKGFLEQARLLISCGVNLNFQDFQGKTPLGLAAWYDHTELAKHLLQSNADVNLVDQWEQTPLHKACGKGNIAIVNTLLEHGANTEIVSKNGYTALHIAAISGYEAVVKSLLDAGACWKTKDSQWHRTALYMCAWKGHLDLVGMLVALHGDQTSHDISRGSLTPLHAATEGSHVDVVRYLLEHQALTCPRDWEGRTPLHYTAISGCSEAAELLLGAGADSSIQDHYGQTALHLAARHGHLDITNKLLATKMTAVNVVDKEGQTAIHYAASCGYLEIMARLIEHGAVRTILNRDGVMAKTLAAKNGHIDAIKLLILVPTLA